MTCGPSPVRGGRGSVTHHVADRQLRVFNANRDIVEVAREIAELTEVAAEPISAVQ